MNPDLIGEIERRYFVNAATAMPGSAPVITVFFTPRRSLVKLSFLGDSPDTLEGPLAIFEYEGGTLALTEWAKAPLDEDIPLEPFEQAARAAAEGVLDRIR